MHAYRLARAMTQANGSQDLRNMLRHVRTARRTVQGHLGQYSTGRGPDTRGGPAYLA
jgi:hypothetical protein